MKFENRGHSEFAFVAHQVDKWKLWRLLTFRAVLSDVSLITGALAIFTAAFVMAVVGAAQLSTAFPFISTLTFASSVDAAPPVVAVIWTCQDRTIVS